MSRMFSHATGFNGDISGWDVSSVENFNAFMEKAYSYDRAGDLAGWEPESATNIAFFAQFAYQFKANLCPWMDHLPATSIKTLAFVGTMCEMPFTPSMFGFCDAC